MKKKSVAIVVQNMVQFYSIKVGIEKLEENKIDFDLFVPKYNDEDGFSDLFEDTYKTLIEKGYNVKRKADKNTSYKILLQSYCLDYMININHKYRLKFMYGTYDSKPNITIIPQSYIPFDATLIFDYEYAELLRNFCPTYLVGNMRFEGYKKKKKIEKRKKILYLPTYGVSTDIEDAINAISKLKDNYDVYIKAHHGTSFLKSEKKNFEKLKNASTKLFDSSTPLVELFEQVDLVISDNSGAIFDSIYAEVPVVIFSKKINGNKITDDFNTEQYELVQKDIIPYTDNPEELEKIVLRGFEKDVIKKQTKYKYEKFYCPENLTIDFINIIKKYLNDDIDKKYKIVHDRLINYIDLLISDLSTSYERNNVIANDYQKLYEEKTKVELENQELRKKHKIYLFLKKEYNKLKKFLSRGR